MSELPIGWGLVTFDEIVTQEKGAIRRGPFGGSLKKEVFVSSGYKVYEQQNAIRNDFSIGSYYINENKYKEMEGFNVYPNDIIVSCAGTIGKVAIVPNDARQGIINQALMRIRPNLLVIIPCYLKLYLESPLAKKEIFEQSVGTALKNLAAISEIRKSRIPLPPINEQRRIVAKLDRLFASSRCAREELGRVSGLCDRYKQAILAAAFRGELTKDWREKNTDISTAKDFLTEASILPTDESNLHSLPNSWCWVMAGNLCAIKSGVALGKKRTSGTQLIELPYLRVANVQRGWLDLNEIKTILVTPKEAEALYLDTGDILMNEGGDRDKLGRGWVWEGEISKCIHQNHVFRLRLKTSKVSPRYVSYYANEFGQRFFMDQGKQTTNLASISMSKLSNFPVPIAPPKEMELILKLVEKLFKAIDAIEQEHQKASKLLDRLEQATLAKAFRGELVPQDPNDEPAAVLLERILADRQEQPKGKAVKSKQKSGEKS